MRLDLKGVIYNVRARPPRRKGLSRPPAAHPVKIDW